MHSTLTIMVGLTLLAASSAAAQETPFPEPVPAAMEGVLGPAADLPERFSARPEAGPVPFGDRACPIEYEDSRDGTVLRLIRSVSSKISRVDGNRRITEEVSYGDYWIAGENRYGLELGRALRIDCVSGRGLGVVPRFR